MQRSRRHTTTSSLPCALAALCSRTEVAIERAAKALKVEGVKRYTDMHALFAGMRCAARSQVAHRWSASCTQTPMWTWSTFCYRLPSCPPLSVRPLKAVGPSHSLRNEFAVDPLCQSQDDTRAALRAPVAATARDLGEAVHRTKSGGGGRQARDLGEADRVECCGCSPPRRCVHLASWRRCGRAAKLMRAALGYTRIGHIRPGLAADLVASAEPCALRALSARSPALHASPQIWDVREGHLLYTLHGHEGAVPRPPSLEPITPLRLRARACTEYPCEYYRVPL